MTNPTDDELLAELADLSTEVFTLTDEYLADKLVPRYVAAQRMTTCKKCDAYDVTLGRCTVNGWIVAEGAGSNKTACPKGLW